MKHHVFDRQLYDECCGDHPRFTKPDGKWSAQCTICGRAVEAEDPGNLPIAWNRSVRKDVAK